MTTPVQDPDKNATTQYLFGDLIPKIEIDWTPVIKTILNHGVPIEDGGFIAVKLPPAVTVGGHILAITCYRKIVLTLYIMNTLGYDRRLGDDSRRHEWIEVARFADQTLIDAFLAKYPEED